MTLGIIGAVVISLGYYFLTSRQRLETRQLEQEYADLLHSDKYRVKGQHEH